MGQRCLLRKAGEDRRRIPLQRIERLCGGEPQDGKMGRQRRQPKAGNKDRRTEADQFRCKEMEKGRRRRIWSRRHTVLDTGRLGLHHVAHAIPFYPRNVVPEFCIKIAFLCSCNLLRARNFLHRRLTLVLPIDWAT